MIVCTVDVPEDDNPPDGLIAGTIIASVLGDIQCVEARLSDMTQKLSGAISVLSAEKAICTGMGELDRKASQASVDAHSATHDHVTPHTVDHKEGEETFTSADRHFSQSDTDAETNQSTQDIKTNPHDAASLCITSHSEDEISSPVSGRHSSDKTDTQQDSGATGQQPGITNGHPMGHRSPTRRDKASISGHIGPSLSGVR